MKRIISVAALLAFLGVLAVSLHQTSEADARDPNCIYKNGDSDTDTRNRRLNGYNVCVTADYMERVTTARPYPSTQIEDSVERRNLTEKLLRYNDANKISYITLITHAGTVLATYTIQGKVSSNQSSLTAGQQCTWQGNDQGGFDGCVISPGDDGSYGENETGIFFFTTGGVMVTWNGDYLLTDAPQQVTPQPIITYSVSDKPSSSFEIGR